jgi:PelA/Pel-15E family pectate lyase
MRVKGQSYAPNNLSRYLSNDDFDAPRDPQWNYVGTLDNDATVTQMLFLAGVAYATPGAKGQVYRESFLRAVRYLLAAQFPNGGWPQVWPLEGGYHDAITFNDDAMIHAMKVLLAVAQGKEEFNFIPAELKTEASEAVERGIQCILVTQVVLHGQRTIWGQQHDALTLLPVAARNFEPAALASAESSNVLQFLMTIPNPSKATKDAIQGGVMWLEKRMRPELLTSRALEKPDIEKMSALQASGPWWARFYSLQTETPIFGDRDKTIHTEVYELSPERQKNYSW